MCMGLGLTYIKGRRCLGGQDYRKNLRFLALSQQNKKNRNEGSGKGGEEGKGIQETHRWIHFLHQVSREEASDISCEILEEQGVGEVAQASHGKKSGGERFHETKRKAKEAMARGTTVSDDLALMAIVATGMSYGRVYRTGSEVAHLRTENSRAPS
ncbi:hypothetical protein M9H77_21325 [Catharanthus roseus]|uniref:Uncharacterized protein n=1 Tax=Catharanthus roseus TaxID=4058 RepID=A0ACC0ANH6_CATRO|nr:hypothetical protein M9H77_21325 [Catharanthus roseus]